jgi:Sulfotransferase family
MAGPAQTRSPTTEAAVKRGAAYLRSHEDRLGWIMGSSRSGSTWLLRMLSELEPVVGIDDPHLGHHLGVWRPQPLAWATAEAQPELTTLEQLKRGEDDFFFAERYRDAWMPPLRDLIRRRFGAQLAETRPLDAKDGQARAAPVVVVKEPGSQAVEMLLDLFPGSRLVFLLRDGRDVVDSWLDGYRDGSWAIAEGAFAVAPEGRVALASWLGTVWAYRTRAVARAFARLPADRRVLVRYEELLGDTAGELKRVCAALGIDIAPRELKRVADEHAFERVTRGERGPLHAVRNAAPGGWRRRPAAERRAMHQAMASELTRWGYLGTGPARRAA